MKPQFQRVSPSRYAVLDATGEPLGEVYRDESTTYGRGRTRSTIRPRAEAVWLYTLTPGAVEPSSTECYSTRRVAAMELLAHYGFTS